MMARKRDSRNGRVLCALLSCCVLFWASLATAERQKAVATTEARSVEVWESSEELHETLQAKEPLEFTSTREPHLTIAVNDGVKYQQMDGFGASLTDSSAWLLWTKLSERQRAETIRMFFSRDRGIGLSVLRQPMGASDFAAGADYTYDEMPEGEKDSELRHFSIDHDREYIVPILKQALAVNPKLKIMGTPWSAPGWMKTSGAMIGGTLRPESYAALARYFVRYVQQYEAAGVPIYAVTPQNEPMYVPKDYPGMGMTAAEQAEFVGKHLGPAFRAAKLKTKILVFDHNWDLIQYPLEVLRDATAAAFVAGTATHCYGGAATAQNELHERFPGKDIWMTECSGGEWQKGKLLVQQTRLVIDATRNWAKSVVLWNLALNQLHQPYLGGCKECRGVVTVDESKEPAEVTTTVDFAALGHASKFVEPGAYRVESNSFGPGSLENVAFVNADGSVVLVVLNSGGNAEFNIGWRGEFATYKLAGGAVATFRWNGRGARH